MRLPREIGPIHFVGIGGIGMSGIAEVLCNLGYTVQGSDASEGANVARLRAKGIAINVGHKAENVAGADVVVVSTAIKRDNLARLRAKGIAINVGHKAENVAGADVVVVSTAIKRDNPELLAARAQRIPVVRRAEMLAELMRLKSCVAIAGTHGKTTTTSLVAALLDAGEFDPTVINGGIINAYGTNARLGDGEWMVVEADESDGTFLKLPADVAIVTNVDPEHLDHFKTFEAVQEAFRNFVENVPFYGFAVMCIDHPVVQALVGKIEDRRIITYGENPQADVRLLDLTPNGGASRFKVAFRDRKAETAHEIDDLMLPMPGRHNALNATAAIAVAHELGLPDDVIRKALAGFGGVRRRFTKTGEHNGITVIDDYGHHPVEIAAVLKAARESTGNRVIAVVQPHRYTRLQSLFEEFCTCFNDADTVVVAEVYPAGETPIAGIDRDNFVLGLRAHGHREAAALKWSRDGANQPAGLMMHQTAAMLRASSWPGLSRPSTSSLRDGRKQVIPTGVDRQDHPDLPSSRPVLDVVLALDSGLDILEMFEVHQPLQPVSLGEAVHETFAVLIHAADQIAGDADIQDAVRPVSQNIDIAASHAAPPQDVDGRDKPGHDVLRVQSITNNWAIGGSDISTLPLVPSWPGLSRPSPSSAVSV